MYSERQQHEDDYNEEPPSTATNANSIRTLKNSGINNSSKTQNKIGFTRKKYSSSYDMKQHLEDPFRFTGEGIDFKSKFIGEQEVVDARGDRMCQNAMQACKARAKRRGEHKQRIWFNVSLKGFKIKDQMTGVILHTFPVNKVSFIAKDITDGRAFGFVYGGPDEKHKFFAIKTEKSANSVVFSIRDMFQIVYEIKKKQIEEAKMQQIMQQQNVLNKLQADAQTTGTTNGRHIQQQQQQQNEHLMECTAEYGEPAVGHLLDLELELENLEQDIQNINDWAAFSDEISQNVENNQLVHSVSAPNGYPIDQHFQAKSALDSNGFAQPAFQSRPRPTFHAKANEDIVATLPPPSAPHSSRRSHANVSQPSLNGVLFSNFEHQPSKNITPGTVSQPVSVDNANDPFDTSHVTQILKENWTINNTPSLPPPYAYFRIDESLPVGSNDTNSTQQSSSFELLTPQMLNPSTVETSLSTTSTIDHHELMNSVNPSIANGQSASANNGLEKSTFDKLCNLDTLSNPSTQKLQTIGVITTTATGAMGIEKCSSKKSLNEMRDEKNPISKMTVTQQCSYDLQPVIEKSISLDFFNENHDVSTNNNSNSSRNVTAPSSSFSPVPPIIPPRAVGTTPAAALPRPEVGQRQAKGLLPPPLSGTSRRQSSEGTTKTSGDPFADDFFS